MLRKLVCLLCRGSGGCGGKLFDGCGRPVAEWRWPVKAGRLDLKLFFWLARFGHEFGCQDTTDEAKEMGMVDKLVDAARARQASRCASPKRESCARSTRRAVP